MSLNDSLFWHEKLALLRVGDQLPVDKKQSVYSAISQHFKEPFLVNGVPTLKHFSVKIGKKGLYVIRKNDKQVKK